MLKTIPPGSRTGSVTVPASKSFLHRYLIAAALSQYECQLQCDTLPEDVQATLNGLLTMKEKTGALSGKIRLNSEQNIVNCPEIQPAVNDDSKSIIQLDCGESGTTLRFLLPVAAALGISADFILKGRLADRPIDPLIRVLSDHGAVIRKEPQKMHCSGKLQPGDYHIPGNISSQFISGLLFALPLLEGESRLTITEKIESKKYIEMTEHVLSASNIIFDKCGIVYQLPGGQQYAAPKQIAIEKDWSSAAFFLCMGAYSEQGILIRGLKTDSLQGDAEMLEILRRFGAKISVKDEGILVQRNQLLGQTVSAAEIPDLVPALTVLAAGAEGITQITNAGRLRYKESDRLKSTAGLLKILGGDIEETADGLIIYGKNGLKGGWIDPVNDHRIAMAAAQASCICSEPVVIKNAACVAKSYPDFWKDFERLDFE